MTLQDLITAPPAYTTIANENGKFTIRIKHGMKSGNIFMHFLLITGCCIMCIGSIKTILPHSSSTTTLHTWVEYLVLSLFGICGLAGSILFSIQILNSLFGETTITILPGEFHLIEKGLLKTRKDSFTVIKSGKLSLNLENSSVADYDTYSPDSWDLFLTVNDKPNFIFSRDKKTVTSWLGNFLSIYYAIEFSESAC